VASSQYKPQLLGRAGWGDWKEAYGHVLDDIVRKGGTGDPPSVTATPGGRLFEAEQAKALSATYQTSVSGYTGSGYVTMNGAGSSLTFTIDIADAGEYVLEFRYILSAGEGDMLLSINGEDPDSISFWSTGGSSSWAWDRKAVYLEKGPNTVVIKSNGLSPELDHVNVLLGHSQQGYALSEQ
jgi:hypothetical protein